MAEEPQKTPGQYIDEFKKAIDYSPKEFEEAFERVGSVARVVNNTFGQSRERINEIKVAIADTLPGVTKLGGDIGEVGETIGQIAEVSRRGHLQRHRLHVEPKPKPFTHEQHRRACIY